jgi:hypothetical protein
MSWKAEAHKIYEERVVNDSLARLAERVGDTPLTRLAVDGASALKEA